MNIIFKNKLTYLKNNQYVTKQINTVKHSKREIQCTEKYICINDPECDIEKQTKKSY